MQALVDFSAGLQWWHWFMAAAVLGAIEAMLPGAVAVWFAAGAAVTGVVVLAVPITWQWQLMLFALLSVAALAAWRVFKRTHPETSDLPQLNQRAAQYVGRVCVLSDSIVQGYGKARVGDGYWKVRGPDLPAGTEVRVTAADGALLVVERA
jgi:membrane protein implicated in regulation of membrane protease activity